MKMHEILSEVASAGATGAASVATVVNPITATSKSYMKKGKYGAPEAPQNKKKDGTAQNALDMNSNLMGGDPIKR